MKVNNEYWAIIASVILSIAGIISSLINHDYLLAATWLVLGLGNDMVIYSLHSRLYHQKDKLEQRERIISRLLEELSEYKGE